ncbi:MAG TPA: LPS export ABC transporter permease LptG [Thermoanaerobaculia bacterium]|nr:LPS export ABC transporter permease LptG [Thermoanaerobaculia bacterium]
MRLISRAVLREIVPPFLLGFVAYTFILLLRTILVLADFAVRRSAPLVEVLRLVALSLPWIIVLTLPMAFLLGVLVGLGRLGADSELTALSACGIGPTAIYRPLLGAAAIASAGVLFLYNVVLPPANESLQREMSRVAATSIVNVVAPRTFREPRPGITFFFDRVAPDGRSFDNVFLKLGDELEPPNRVIVARRGGLTLEGDRLWLDLSQSTVHELDPEDPTRYRATRNASQRLLLAGEPGPGPAGSSVTIQRAWRAQSLTELLAAVKRMKPSDPDRRLALVEVHKKLAIPFACVAFAWVGIPLARRLRRGGRGGSFAASLLILVGYYILLTSGETWAQDGRLSPGVAMWLPNAALLLLGAVAAMWRGDGRAPRLPRAPVEEAGPEAPAAGTDAADAGSAPPTDDSPPGLLGSASVSGSRFRLSLVSLADRYVLARFLVALALVLGSALLLSIVVDYVDQLDEFARHHPPSTVVLGYYRAFIVSITMQIAPFAILLATLVGLGILSRNNEDTAFRACGISAPRLAAPVLVFAIAAAGVAFAFGEYVLPFAEQKQEQYRNVIHGRPADFGIKTAAERNWYLASDGRIWFREEADDRKGTLDAVTVFETGPDGQLVRRTSARVAEWKGDGWLLRQGWDRRFDGPEGAFKKFLEEPVAGDPPRALSGGRRRPEEMRFRELQRLARRLRASGYPTAALDTALQSKLAQPAMLPVMALLATPFAFRIGRKGTLAGVGVGLALGIVALVAAAFMSKLGVVGALPPTLAAWAPDVLFGLAAAYFLLRMRT